MTTDLFHPLRSHGIGDSSLFTSRPFEKSPIRIICRGELVSRGQRTFKGKGAAFALKMQKKKNVPRPVRTALLRMGWSLVSSATFCRRTQLCFSQTSLWLFRARPGKLCWVQVNNAFTQSRLRFSSYNIILTSSLQCSKKWTAGFCCPGNPPLLTNPTAALCLSVGIWNFPRGQVPI